MTSKKITSTPSEYIWIFRYLWGGLLCAALAFFVYVNNYHNDYHFDDKHVVRENQELRNSNYFQKNWEPFSSRSLAYALFALDYQKARSKARAFQKTADYKSLDKDVREKRLQQFFLRQYHFTNNILHVLSTIAVFLFLVLIFRHDRFAALEPKYRFGITFFITALFAVHPIQLMAVTYLTQRFACGAALLFLLGASAYMGGRLLLAANTSPNGEKTTTQTLLSALLFAAAAALFLFAYYFKQNAVTYPGFLVLYELLIASRGERRPFQLVGKKKTASRGTMWAAITLFIALLSVPALFNIYTASPVSHLLQNKVSQLFSRSKSYKTSESNRVYLGEEQYINRWTYLLTQPRVIIQYYRLTLFPVGLNIDHYVPWTDIRAYGANLDEGGNSKLIHLMPESKSRKNELLIKTFAASLTILLILAVLILYQKKSTLFGSLALFGFLWQLASLSLESSFFPLRDALFEHRLYLGFGAGLLTFVAPIFHVVYHFRDKKPAIMKVAAIAGGVIIIVLGAMTLKRNTYWTTEIRVWRRAATINPKRERAHYNLGYAFKKEDRIYDAIKSFKRTLELNKRYIRAWNNLGLCYYQLYIDDLRSYQRELRQSIGHKMANHTPQEQKAYYQKKIASFRNKNKRLLQKGIHCFNSAIDVNPEFHKAYNNMGICYRLLGQRDKSFALFKKGVSYHDEYSDGYFNLGLTYEERGELKKSFQNYLNAYRYNRRMHKARRKASLILYKQAFNFYKKKNYENTVSITQKALKIDSRNEKAARLRGIALMRLKQYKSAQQAFLHCISINKKDVLALTNLGILSYRNRRFRQAKKWLERALKNKPGYSPARQQLKKVRQKLSAQ